MKLICIDTSSPLEGKEQRVGYYNITMGQIYETADIFQRYWGEPKQLDWEAYWIRDDHGQIRALPKSCFIPLSEYRNNKIDQLLDETQKN